VATPALAVQLLGPPSNPRHENWMETPKRLGSKATVGAGCVIAGGADIGDKTSVKRSVIGPGVVLGNSVKVRWKWEESFQTAFQVAPVSDAMFAAACWCWPVPHHRAQHCPWQQRRNGRAATGQTAPQPMI